MANLISTALIKERVLELLIDPDGDRWTDAELVQMIGDAQHEIVLLRPEAGTNVTRITLVDGCEQSINNTELALLRVICNTNATGTVDGRNIALVSKERVDRLRPGWPSESKTSSIEAYAINPASPRTFFVYPPALADYTVVKAEVITRPTAPSGVADGEASEYLQIDDIYVNRIIEYVMHRAYQKDAAESVEAMQLSMMYNQLFLTGLGRTDLLYSKNAYTNHMDHR